MSAMLDLTGIDFMSHSKLNVFQECGKLFEYEYILKERVRSEANHFIIGSACHKCIEMYYLSPELGSPLEYADIYWRDWLRSKGLGFLLGNLKAVYADIGQLYVRASAEYQGADAIRRGAKKEKGEKSFPRGPEYWKNPVADSPAMTGDWKNAVAALDLDNRMHEIDIELVNKGPEWARVSLSTCYAEVREILTHYRDPECLAEVKYVEFPISHRVWEGKTVVDVVNPVFAPGSTKTLINGYIDLVGVMTPAYGGGIAMGDYKSSKKEVSVVEVMYHEQLNAYGWLWKQLTGAWPTHLFINNLRFGTVTLAPFNPEIAEAVIARRMQVDAASKDKKNYIKRDPFGWNSPCLTMSRDGKGIDEYCAHFTKCHEGPARALGLLSEPLADGFAVVPQADQTRIAAPTLKDGF